MGEAKRRGPCGHYEKTFADRILEVPEDQIDVLGLREAHDALKVPWSRYLSPERANHIVASSARMARTMAHEAEARSAAQYIVSEEVAEVAVSMMRDAASAQYTVERAKPISQSGWVEWSRSAGPGFGHAVLWSISPNGYEIRVYLKVDDGAPFYIGRGCGIDFVNVINGVRIFIDRHGAPPSDAYLFCAHSIKFVLCFFAFMATQHACETHIDCSPEKLNADLHRRGRPYPLLSMNRVAFSTRQETILGAPEGKAMTTGMIRFHQVIGHWRRLYREGKLAGLTWIESFWRGNAERGTVLKTREVKVKRKQDAAARLTRRFPPGFAPGASPV